jgi:hypothetical protein
MTPEMKVFVRVPHCSMHLANPTPDYCPHCTGDGYQVRWITPLDLYKAMMAAAYAEPVR